MEHKFMGFIGEPKLVFGGNGGAGNFLTKEKNMQVKQIYKDVVTLVEGDNVFHLDSRSVLRNEIGAQLMTKAVLSQNATGERDLSLDQEWGK